MPAQHAKLASTGRQRGQARSVLSPTAWPCAQDEGLIRVGWSSKAASLELGTDKHGFGYGSTGKRSHARAFEDYGGAFQKAWQPRSFACVPSCRALLRCCPSAQPPAVFAAWPPNTTQGCVLARSSRLQATLLAVRPALTFLCGVQGDVIGCTLDKDHSTVSFTRNGADLGEAFQVPQHLQRAALYPALCLKNGEVALNFGGAPLRYQPPEMATPLQQLPGESLISGRPCLLAPRQAAHPPDRCILAHGQHVKPRRGALGRASCASCCLTCLRSL